MKLTSLFILIGFILSPLDGINDEPNRHPLESNIAPSSSFGMIFHPILEIDRFHTGVDFTAENGSAVYATADGAIIVAEENNGLGKHIRIQHANGFETVYAHLGSIRVTTGMEVQKGEQIGLTGNTELSSGGPHLHYEIRKDREPVNPVTYLP